MTIVDIFLHAVTNHFRIFFQHIIILIAQFGSHFVSHMNQLTEV